MKPGSNRRPRSRPNNNNPNNNKRQGGKNSYDSNGPEGKVRGTAQQVLEKYQALGRDATSAGDRVAAEAYFQFAEHYYRVVSADGGVQLPHREQLGDETSENDAIGNEKLGPSIVAKASPNHTVDEPIDEIPIIEVINVPIMPGPIALPISGEEPVVGDDAVSMDMQIKKSVASENDTDDCTSKPIRRRRVKAKLHVEKTESETSPIEV